MDEDTKNLLLECNSGCKMALNSMQQVNNDIGEEKLKNLITDYKKRLEKLEEDSSNLLKQYKQEEKEPSVIASTFSWFNTELKLIVNNTDQEIAKLMMDGCNMGIQSISKYQNQYTNASKESMLLANELVRTQEDFMKDLKVFV